MFAIVMCLVMLRCTLTICSSVLCAFMVEGMSAVVKVMLSLMSVISPPPSLCVLSFLTVVYAGIFGVFEVLVSLVSCMVMISACVSCMSCFSSSILFLMPFMFICRIMRSLLFLSCVCLACLVTESSVCGVGAC